MDCNFCPHCGDGLTAARRAPKDGDTRVTFGRPMVFKGGKWVANDKKSGSKPDYPAGRKPKEAKPAGQKLQDWAKKQNANPKNGDMLDVPGKDNVIMFNKKNNTWENYTGAPHQEKHYMKELYKDLDDREAKRDKSEDGQSGPNRSKPNKSDNIPDNHEFMKKPDAHNLAKFLESIPKFDGNLLERNAIGMVDDIAEGMDDGPDKDKVMDLLDDYEEDNDSHTLAKILKLAPNNKVNQKDAVSFFKNLERKR